MEHGRSLFHSNNYYLSSNNGGGGGRSQDNSHTDHNSNCTSNDATRAIWSSSALPPMDWVHSNSFHQAAATVVANPVPQGGGDGVFHALTVHNMGSLQSASPFSFNLYRGGGGGGVGGSQYCCHPDPHLMCLKLGKRHYFGDAAAPLGDRGAATAAAFANNNTTNNVNTSAITKRCKPYCELFGAASASGGATVASAVAGLAPRCQVDGCHVALVNAKEYHKRHKVCEMHSKAPKALVLGLEQRFCQQCSRFHAVGEFDESKRSCRRRLAGHNERRRKSSQDHPSTTPKNPSHQVNGKAMTHSGMHPYFPCALSLLSSKNDAWISTADLPVRCSAALRELIAENRAANVLARQLILDSQDWHSWQRHHHEHHHSSEDANNRRQNVSMNCGSLFHNQQQMAAAGSHGWDRIGEDAGGGHVTLDLMQASNSAFGFLSVGEGKSKEDEECPDLWGPFGGAHVV